MPDEYEEEARFLHQDALQDPLVRIPASLKPAYFNHQKQLTLKYLLQVNLFAQVAYASYTLADILVLNDIEFAHSDQTRLYLGDRADNHLDVSFLPEFACI